MVFLTPARRPVQGVPVLTSWKIIDIRAHVCAIFVFVLVCQFVLFCFVLSCLLFRAFLVGVLCFCRVVFILGLRCWESDRLPENADRAARRAAGVGSRQRGLPKTITFTSQYSIVKQGLEFPALDCDTTNMYPEPSKNAYGAAIAQMHPTSETQNGSTHNREDSAMIVPELYVCVDTYAYVPIYIYIYVYLYFICFVHVHTYVHTPVYMYMYTYLYLPPRHILHLQGS